MQKKTSFVAMVFLFLCIIFPVSAYAAGDWFSLSYQGSTASDASSHAFPLLTVGSPRITEDSIILSNQSAYGIDLTDNHNTALADGFSSQNLSLRAGERTTTSPVIPADSKSMRLFTWDSLASQKTLQQISVYPID